MCCSQIEDYLCRLLSEADMQKFEVHLQSCEECATTVRRDGDVMGLIRHASLTLEQPESDLIASVQVRHPMLVNFTGTNSSFRGSKQNRVPTTAIATVLCGIMLLAAGILVSVEMPPGATAVVKSSVQNDSTDHSPVESKADRVSSRPQVTIASSHTAFEIPSNNSQVRILMLYPKTD